MTLPRRPEDWPRAFEQAINAGDLAQAIELYDPEAKLTPPEGDATVDVEGVRELLAKMIAGKVRFRSRVIRGIQSGDIVVLYTDWTLTTPGTTAENHHRALEVLRRQGDGSWKLIVGDPQGRDAK